MKHLLCALALILPAAPVLSQGIENEQLAESQSNWAPLNGDSITLWTYNGADMAWEVGPGTARTVWYWEPTTMLRDLGINRGTLLFKGERLGQQMIGTAYIVFPDCGDYAYPVIGHIAANDLRVTFVGSAPVIDDSCDVIGERDNILVLEYRRAAPQS